MPTITRCHNMVRVEFEVGVYNEHFEQALKWYSYCFGKENHPSKKDEETFKLFSIIVGDMRRQDKEEETDE